jgi:hypothetical protein
MPKEDVHSEISENIWSSKQEIHKFSEAGSAKISVTTTAKVIWKWPNIGTHCWKGLKRLLHRSVMDDPFRVAVRGGGVAAKMLCARVQAARAQQTPRSGHCFLNTRLASKRILMAPTSNPLLRRTNQSDCFSARWWGVAKIGVGIVETRRPSVVRACVMGNTSE